MHLEACHYFYDPTVERAPFVIYFDQNPIAEQKERAEKVIAHLRSLDHEELIEESIAFFKWLVVHHISVEHTHYCQELLDYFHSHGLLTCKKQALNPLKQLKTRYLVVYTMGKHTFAATYNSIRELKADTGKRPCQIKPQKTSEVMCHRLA